MSVVLFGSSRNKPSCRNINKAVENIKTEIIKNKIEIAAIEIILIIFFFEFFMLRSAVVKFTQFHYNTDVLKRK